MYQEFLEYIEKRLKPTDIKELNESLEVIIKLKTIMAMDTSRDLIAESRKVLKK